MGKEAGYPGWYADFHSVCLFSESCSVLSLPPSAVSLPQLCLNLLSLATSLPGPAGLGGSQFRQITPDILIQIQTQLRERYS